MNPCCPIRELLPLDAFKIVVSRVVYILTHGVCLEILDCVVEKFANGRHIIKRGIEPCIMCAPGKYHWHPVMNVFQLFGRGPG